MNTLLFTLGVGIGATFVSDLWGFARKPLFGVAAPDYALVGRWVAHMRHGQFRHAAIARVPAVRGERLLGWFVHYGIGVAFAGFLVAAGGPSWVHSPTAGLALAVGIATVAAPFLVMQPAMGAGIAASHTPKPVAARVQSLMFHAAYGVGLYLSARALTLLFPV